MSFPADACINSEAALRALTAEPIGRAQLLRHSWGVRRVQRVRSGAWEPMKGTWAGLPAEALGEGGSNLFFDDKHAGGREEIRPQTAAQRNAVPFLQGNLVNDTDVPFLAKVAEITDSP